MERRRWFATIPALCFLLAAAAMTWAGHLAAAPMAALALLWLGVHGLSDRGPWRKPVLLLSLGLSAASLAALVIRAVG